MYVANGELDFAAHFLLINGHFDNLKRETFMEEAIDASAARQFICGDQTGRRTFNGAFHVRGELLDHSVKKMRI